MKNTEIVLSVIKKSSKKLTAYAILEKFQKIKKVQPMTVYRALNDLIEQGVIHKSNQKKIAICKKCGDTEELKSDLFSNLLKKTSIKKYSFSSYEVEVSTICRGCA
jgi:Fur family transcriptional regulator, zinc uptake regulator